MDFLIAESPKVVPEDDIARQQPAFGLITSENTGTSFGATSKLTLPEASKHAKAGRPSRMPLMRSSLPNMPLRELVTPQRPLPPVLKNGPLKSRRPQNAKPPQAARSGSGQSQSATRGKQDDASPNLSIQNGATGLADSLHDAAARVEAPANSSLQPTSASSLLEEDSTAERPADRSNNSLHNISTPSRGTKAPAADSEPDLYTPGSELTPSSPMVTASSEKHKLWELVKQQEQQLAQLRQDRSDQDAAILRLRADKADKKSQAMAVRQLQQQLLEVQSLAGHLRSAAEASESRWASKVSLAV